jgi:hypothetical protein
LAHREILLPLSPTGVATLRRRRPQDDTVIDVGSDMLCDCVREYRKGRRNDSKKLYFIKIRNLELTPTEVERFIARYPVFA